MAGIKARPLPSTLRRLRLYTQCAPVAYVARARPAGRGEMSCLRNCLIIRPSSRALHGVVRCQLLARREIYKAGSGGYTKHGVKINAYDLYVQLSRLRRALHRFSTTNRNSRMRISSRKSSNACWRVSFAINRAHINEVTRVAHACARAPNGRRLPVIGPCGAWLAFFWHGGKFTSCFVPVGGKWRVWRKWAFCGRAYRFINVGRNLLYRSDASYLLAPQRNRLNLERTGIITALCAWRGVFHFCFPIMCACGISNASIALRRNQTAPSRIISRHAEA